MDPIEFIKKQLGELMVQNAMLLSENMKLKEELKSKDNSSEGGSN